MIPRYIDVSLYEDCRIVCNSEDKGVPVNDIPAADVQEVRHGRWMYCGKLSGHGHWWQCSECFRKESTKHKADIKDYPYCYCGAKMDGKE